MAPIFLVLAGAWVFPSPASPRQLLTDEAAFDTFGRAVAAEVAVELAHSDRRFEDGAAERSKRFGARPQITNESLGGFRYPILTPSEIAILWTIQVHWAIHAGDSAAALAAAAALRGQLTQPEQKEFAGVTTAALVSADEAVRHDHLSPAYRKHFQSEYSRRLAALPKSAAMRAVLGKQRAAIAALTPQVLFAEVDRDIPPGSHRAGYSLEQANEIIRARHKLADLEPVRSIMLAELAAAIAGR
jgi:hypothetical protein